MPKKILVDAGPVIALLRSDDEHHAWARDQFSRWTSFVTCEPVVAEICARLQYYKNDPRVVLGMINDGTITIDFDLGESAQRVDSLMEKYSGQMDLADACLVVMTEQEEDCLVITTDTNDFSTYRRFGRDVIPFRSPRKNV